MKFADGTSYDGWEKHSLHGLILRSVSAFIKMQRFSCLLIINKNR